MDFTSGFKQSSEVQIDGKLDVDTIPLICLVPMKLEYYVIN